MAAALVTGAARSLSPSRAPRHAMGQGLCKGCCGWQSRQPDGNWPEKRGGQDWTIITDQASVQIWHSIVLWLPFTQPVSRARLPCWHYLFHNVCTAQMPRTRLAGSAPLSRLACCVLRSADVMGRNTPQCVVMILRFYLYEKPTITCHNFSFNLPLPHPDGPLPHAAARGHVA